MHALARGRRDSGKVGREAQKPFERTMPGRMKRGCDLAGYLNLNSKIQGFSAFPGRTLPQDRLKLVELEK